MKLTREQRIDMAGSSIVGELTRVATDYRKILQEGLDVQAQEGYPALKATGDEVKARMGENLARVEEVLALILDK